MNAKDYRRAVLGKLVLPWVRDDAFARGPLGACPDCRCGARASHLLYRFQVARAGQPDTRRKLRRVLTAMGGS